MAVQEGRTEKWCSLSFFECPVELREPWEEITRSKKKKNKGGRKVIRISLKNTSRGAVLGSGDSEYSLGRFQQKGSRTSPLHLWPGWPSADPDAKLTKSPEPRGR